MRSLDRADRLRASRVEPAAREERLQEHEREEQPDNGRKIEGHFAPLFIRTERLALLR
ncbi:MAG: hypothetical protein ACLPSW_07030 [Roseiarcus sp.]